MRPVPGQPEARKHIGHAFLHLTGRHADVFQTERHIPLHLGGHDLVVRILKHHPHTPSNPEHLICLPNRQPIHTDVALRRLEKTVDAPNQRRLPGAVRTDQGDGLPLSKRQIDPFEYRDLPGRRPVGEMQVLDFDQWAGRRGMAVGRLTFRSCGATMRNVARR